MAYHDQSLRVAYTVAGVAGRIPKRSNVGKGRTNTMASGFTMTMSEKADIEAGMAQMGFEMVDNGTLELPTSTPATYSFAGETTYQPDVFEDALDEHGFGVVGVTTKQKDNGDFYYYADVVTDHYKKVAVKVWNTKANLYPTEDNVDTYEFSRILHAIEDAFGSDLEHRDTND